MKNETVLFIILALVCCSIATSAYFGISNFVNVNEKQKPLYTRVTSYMETEKDTIYIDKTPYCAGYCEQCNIINGMINQLYKTRNLNHVKGNK